MLASKFMQHTVLVVALALLIGLTGCPTSTTVPDVVGMTQGAATTALTNAGLTVSSVIEAYSDTVPVGQVISQDPVAGATVAPGAAVSLAVSLGPESDEGDEGDGEEGEGEGEGETEIVPGEMVCVPAGSFEMGTRSIGREALMRNPFTW